MKCKQVTEVLSEYVDKTLGAALAADVEKHLGECEKCSIELNSTYSMLEALKPLAGMSAPRDCWAAVRTHAESVTAGHARGQWWKPAMAGTAAAALVFAGFMIAGPENQPSSPQVTAQELSEFIGAHSRLEMRNSVSDPYVSFVAAELQKLDESDVRITR